MVDISITDKSIGIGGDHVNYNGTTNRSGTRTRAGDTNVEDVFGGIGIHGYQAVSVHPCVVGNIGTRRVVQQHHTKGPCNTSSAAASTSTGEHDCEALVFGFNLDIATSVNLRATVDVGAGIHHGHIVRVVAKAVAYRQFRRVAIQRIRRLYRPVRGAEHVVALSVYYRALGRLTISVFLGADVLIGDLIIGNNVAVGIQWVAVGVTLLLGDFHATFRLAIKERAHRDDPEGTGYTCGPAAGSGKGHGVDVLLGGSINNHVFLSINLRVLAYVSLGGVECHRHIGSATYASGSAARTSAAHTDSDYSISGLDLHGLVHVVNSCALIDLGVIADPSFSVGNNHLDPHGPSDSG